MKDRLLIISAIGIGFLFLVATLFSVSSHAVCGTGVCGNGVVEMGEQCDDGNLEAGDGCAPDCNLSFNMEVQPPLFTYPDGYPRAMATGDLNNDGIKDFVVTTFRSAYLYSYLVMPNGSIVQKGQYGLGSNTGGVAIGNLNGDHFIDVATIDIDTDQMHIFFGNGDGTMQLVKIFTPGDRPRSIKIADINNDGFDDIIAGCLYSNGFRIYYGNGLGDFIQTEFIYTGGDALFSEVYDFNGDGFNDLVLASYGGGAATNVYHGGPDGLTLAQILPYPLANLKAVDLNQDGYTDVFAYGSTNIMSFLNQGDGTFVFSNELDTGKQGHIMDVGDFDHDGKMDVTISTRTYREVRVCLGDGNGWIRDFLVYTVPDDTDGVIIIDLNLDGTPDILASLYYTSSQRKVVPIHNHNYYQFPRCGDSKIGRGENCDDGNVADGDGCSAVCRIEVSGDTDHDGLEDNEEIFIHGTDPLNPDTDGDCVFDGAEVCAGQDPLDPGDQEGCEAIVTPAGQWKIQVTLTEASAGLKSDVWLAEPALELLIKNTLKRVGRVATTEVLSGETVTFFIQVDATSWGLGIYDHYSDSVFARVHRIDAYKYTVSFEDLPVEQADWDYNDVVLLVEFLPVAGAEGVSQNALTEFQAVANADPGAGADLALPFDGFAAVSVPGAGLAGPVAVVLTAGLAENYAELESWGFETGGKYAKLTLTNGQTELAGGAEALVTIAYEDADGDGVMDGTDLLESGLAIARWDEDAEKWVSLASTVDPVANTVTASTGRTGLLAVGAEGGSINIDCGVVPGPGAGSLLWFLVLVPALALRLVRARKT